MKCLVFGVLVGLFEVRLVDVWYFFAVWLVDCCDIVQFFVFGGLVVLLVVIPFRWVSAYMARWVFVFDIGGLVCGLGFCSLVVWSLLCGIGLT